MSINQTSLNNPLAQVDYGVIVDYPHSVKFVAILSDRAGVALGETAEILFPKPSHPCFSVTGNHIATSDDVFAKLVSWLADKKLMYSTSDMDMYANKIHYLANA